MRIVVCYKNVPEEQDIVIKADHTLDLSSAAWKIGQYDLNAIEAGVALAASCGNSEVFALTAAGRVIDDSKMKKSILSRGPHKMIGVQDDTLENADTFTIATALKATIEKIGNVDLVLFGEGSGDMYSQQTGSVTGAILGWPTLNAIQKITYDNGRLFLERSVEDGVEHLEVTLPAAISVVSDINTPRIPSMKDILGAGKKPVEVWPLGDLITKPTKNTEVISILAPENTERKKIIIEGDSEEKIEELYQHLRKIL